MSSQFTYIIAATAPTMAAAASEARTAIRVATPPELFAAGVAPMANAASTAGKAAAVPVLDSSISVASTFFSFMARKSLPYFWAFVG